MCAAISQVGNHIYLKKLAAGEIQGPPPSYVTARKQARGPMPVWAMILLGVTSVIALATIIVLLVLFI